MRLSAVLAALLVLSTPAGAHRGTGPEPSRGTPELRGVDALVRVYDAILDARFEQADIELQRACGSATAPTTGPAPTEACDVLAATATWWRILLDPDNRSLDDELTGDVDLALVRTEAWVSRDAHSAEAQF